MAREISPLDKKIIKALQDQGLTKKEAKICLKKDVYQLQPDEILKVKNYATHFGIEAKDKLIQEILELRREMLYGKIAKK